MNRPVQNAAVPAVKTTRHVNRRLIVALVASSASFAAQALQIVPTFGPGVSASAQSAFNYAAAEFQALYSDPVKVNINVVAGNTGLGGSSTPLMFVVPATYAAVRSALIADQTAHPSTSGGVSVAAGGSVNTVVDPTNGGVFLYTTAQAKALGALPANNAASDGTFTYNSTLAYTFDPNNRGSGGYDFIGVAEHEISEIMGRIPGLGGEFCGPPNPCGPNYLVYDLFRYTGNNTRGMTDGAGRYFSINNGASNLHGYNFANGNGSDPQDWDASNPTDPYNAFTGPNQAHALNTIDATTLDVIGWDLVTAVPEPAALALLLAGLGVVACSAGRRRNALQGRC